MVRRAKAYLSKIKEKVIEDEDELQKLSDKCEPPLQAQFSQTVATVPTAIQVTNYHRSQCDRHMSNWK